MESSDAICVQAYDIICSIQSSVDSKIHPNLTAQLNSLDIDPDEKAKLRQYSLDCVLPCFAYFKKKFCGHQAEFSRNVMVFKACRLFDPTAVSSVTNPELDILMYFPFVTAPLLSILTLSFPNYKHLASTYECNDTDSTKHTLDWWKKFGHRIPEWSAVAKKVFLLFPTSASCERVFSLMSASYGVNQNDTLVDSLEAAMLLQFNR